MARHDGETAPWTDEEDIFLSQGFAIFHDDKTNLPDCASIRNGFPFREERKPADLADRWHELTDRLEAEDQETIARIKNQSKSHRPQTWTYKFEPQVDLPPLDDILDEYRQMPSLAMKTRFTEISNSRFVTEPKNINESCLNHQYEATNINRIVQEVLQKTLDDEPLRAHVLGQFHKFLIAKGRAFAIEDANRRLEVINDMTDHALAETEAQIMIEYFQRILSSIQMKNRQPVNNIQTIADWLDIFKMLLTVKWPHNPSTYVDSIKREFKQRFYQTVAEIFSIRHQLLQERPQLLAPLVEKLTEFDRNAEFDAMLHMGIRHIFASLRKQFQQG